MSSPSPLGPYKLVSVNKSPERAKRLIGVLIDDMKDKYTLVHVGNAESELKVLHPSLKTWTNLDTAMDEVEPLVSEHRPDLLVSNLLDLKVALI